MSQSTQNVVFEAIGTRWQIDCYEPSPTVDLKAVLQEVQARIEQFDRAYSRFREDSLVTEISKRAGTYQLPDDALPMLRLYEDMYKVTSGLVTPLIGQVLAEAGYDAHYSLKSKDLHEPPAWEDVIRFEPPHILRVKQPVLLDFGAMGKGYLIDIVAELLWEKGIRSFCVEAGGDMLYRTASSTPLRVGLEHPENTSQVIGVATLVNKSLCGSAGNRRAWAHFHHLINPKTLTSPRNILAVWAAASTTLLADAVTTGLFFVSPEILLKYYAFEYAIMYADRTVKQSPGFPGKLFTAS